MLLNLALPPATWGRGITTVDVPAKTSAWTLTASYDDTGHLWGCVARARLADLDVGLNRERDHSKWTFSVKYTRGGRSPGVNAIGDQRPCAVSRTGAWHYAPERGRREFCDGSTWQKLANESHVSAALLVDDAVLASTEEDAYAISATVGGKRMFFSYHVSFGNLATSKFPPHSGGRASLRLGSEAPLSLDGLRLDQIARELDACERQPDRRL